MAYSISPQGWQCLDCWAIKICVSCRNENLSHYSVPAVCKGNSALIIQKNNRATPTGDLLEQTTFWYFFPILLNFRGKISGPLNLPAKHLASPLWIHQFSESCLVLIQYGILAICDNLSWRWWPLVCEMSQWTYTLPSYGGAWAQGVTTACLAFTHWWFNRSKLGSLGMEEALTGGCWPRVILYSSVISAWVTQGSIEDASL